jgi:hypothetical protein
MERITLESSVWRRGTYVLAAVADPLGLDHPGERALVGLLDLHLPAETAAAKRRQFSFKTPTVRCFSRSEAHASH